MSADRHEFQAEVQQLLHLMIHSLYSNREIFLRELISNAADALDKLRFESIRKPDLVPAGHEPAVDVLVDKDAGTITVRDNGIGMNREEVIENLGTIARSGTKRFMEALSGDQKRDAQLIGQFGVGFYSAFIVADTVTVLSRRAGEQEAVRWSSDGKGSYSLEPATKDAHGTDVILKLRDDAREFLEPMRLRFIVERYSEHIGVPIRMRSEDGKKLEAVNQGRAFWTRPRAELKDEDYQRFYEHLTHDDEPPLAWSHNQVEGTLEYTSLLFIPSRAPFDLWDREQRRGLKLYVRRVFIMDNAEQLLPSYLRFVRGVVDSADLPLNVSRELLQDDRTIRKIRTALVKRVLDLLETLATDRPDDYRRFWKEYGQVLKEGIVEDPENRERIAALLRFASSRTADEQWLSLDEYIQRIADGQGKVIHYLTADRLSTARNSPHLEGFRKAGREVLLLTDRIDEWVVGHLREYKGYRLESVTSGTVEFGGGAQDKQHKALEEQYQGVLERIGKVLGDRVAGVRASRRLTDSPACLVFDEAGVSVHLQRLLKEAGQPVPELRPVLEVNAAHPLVARMESTEHEGRFGELARLLFDQAVLAEGGQLEDPAAFVRSLNTLLLGMESSPERADSAAGE